MWLVLMHGLLVSSNDPLQTHTHNEKKKETKIRHGKMKNREKLHGNVFQMERLTKKNLPDHFRAQRIRSAQTFTGHTWKNTHTHRVSQIENYSSNIPLLSWPKKHHPNELRSPNGVDVRSFVAATKVNSITFACCLKFVSFILTIQSSRPLTF